MEQLEPEAPALAALVVVAVVVVAHHLLAAALVRKDQTAATAGVVLHHIAAAVVVVIHRLEQVATTVQATAERGLRILELLTLAAAAAESTIPEQQGLAALVAVALVEMAGVPQ